MVSLSIEVMMNLSLFRETTWIQKPWIVQKDDQEWKAEIVLSNGTHLIKSVRVSKEC